MKLTIKQAFGGYSMLFDYTNYRIGEIIIKTLLMPIVFIVFTLLFVVTWAIYFIERLLSPIFKLFLLYHMAMMRWRSSMAVWKKRFINVLTLIVTFVSIPFVLGYYACMFIKALTKYFMRNLIIKMDFSVQFSYSDLRLFDDRDRTVDATMAEMFKDASKTQALGKMLEAYINEAPDDGLGDE